MDRAKFGPSSPGRLVPLTVGNPDWAFIPDPLPHKWTVPVSLWPMLATAKEELARLDGIGRTLPDPELLLRPLQSREALRSSSLEGTYATPRELLLFQLEPTEPATANDPANDWREVANYAVALQRGTELLDELPLSLRLIREMHHVLLDGVRGRDRAPGEFRRQQVHVGSGRRYIPPPITELDGCLDAFERFLNGAEDTDPLVRTYLAHYQFEAIHPFTDGNGRVGRALVSLTAYKWCGLSRPWLYISPYFDRYKSDYIESLFAVSTDGDWDRWLSLCCRATIEMCRDAVLRCDELRRIRDEFHKKADRSSGRAHRIIEKLFSNPIVRIADIARRLDVTYPTAKADVYKLMEAGILEDLSGTRPAAFYSRQIFDAAYREHD